jgi:hypothetical protein
MGIGFLWSKAAGVKLTTHLSLLPRLKMSGAAPLLPLYAFMAWTGKTLTLYLYVKYSCFKNWCHKFGQKFPPLPVPNKTTCKHINMFQATGFTME